MCTAVSTLNEMDAFFDELRKADKRALLLDYDGTLAPFQTNRNAALPYVGVAELLVSIIMGSTRTRVVLITGRTAHELRRLLALVPAPEIWGSHGLERLRPDGQYELAPIPRPASRLMNVIDRYLQAEGLESCVERKPGAIAVHWRGRSSAEDIRGRVVRVWQELRAQSLVKLAEFDGGLEFRVVGRNKGDAVRHILAELDGATPVAYLGDDLTDEDAFKALDNRGLSVLVRKEYRPTAANIWIQPPQGLLEFLAHWLQACGGGQG